VEVHPLSYWSAAKEDHILKGPRYPRNWGVLLFNIWWLHPNSYEYKVFWSLYRQRAWAFFDDRRLYPESWTFPTRSSFREESARAGSPGAQWHIIPGKQVKDEDEEMVDRKEYGEIGDSIPSPPEAFKSGNMGSYPSVEERMVSFWQ
jgi:hypothetical protein